MADESKQPDVTAGSPGEPVAGVVGWLGELNERQLEAVTVAQGPLLVLAGPGSGKTRVLTYRAAWLVAAQSARPGQVLCVTFTNKAAQEMRLRLERLLGDQARDLRIHTFHALAARILREFSDEADLGPRFAVADDEQQARILTELVRRRDLSREQFPTYRLAEFISEFKRDLRDPAQASPGEFIQPEMIDLAADYAAELRSRGLLDFDDLIGYTVRLLAGNRQVRTQLQQALPHILVDEYQDINRAQFELLKLLAPRNSDVVAVADEAQSIYGWRGAYPELIEDFRHFYHARVVALELSYRSTQTILDAAQAMIRRNALRVEERRPLRTTQGPGEPIYHYVFAHSRQEQDWLVRLIGGLVAKRGFRYGDIAVLYRTHELGNALEGALLQAEIPVYRVRKESFFTEPLAREVVRYLHLVRSLASDDLLAAFNFPQTLADELTVLQLQRLANVHALPLAELARQSAGFPELSPLTRANLTGFMRLFDEQLVPYTGEGARAVVTALFDALERRSSPFSAEEFRLLRDAAAFFRFAGPAVALRDYLAAGGRAQVLAPATADGAAAAALLADVARRYLDAEITPLLQSVDPAADAARGLQIVLGPTSAPIEVSAPAGSLPYSLAEVAWRLAQELIIAHETLPASPLVVFDLETTGTDVRRDEIVEIAAQRVENGAASGPGFYSLVHPEHAIPRPATAVHGIHTADVAGAEPIGAVLPRFLRYVGGQTVAGHNIIAFDNRLIDRDTGRLFRRGFPNPAVDTLEMARRLLRDELGATGDFSLTGLLQRFGLADKAEHRAAADVAQTVALLQRLLDENALQLALAALPEYLPLVAAGMAAAGVPLRDENLALWRGGIRMARRLGGGEAGLPAAARAGELLSGDPAAQDALAAGLTSLADAEVPPLDGVWLELRERFMEQVDIFENFANDRSLAAFLDYQALVSGLDTMPPAPDGRVTLMTLHNAKGTEFPVVIIVGVEEEMLPLWTTLDDPRLIAEERRVFYVGLTRAQRRVYLTSVRQRGEGPIRTASRFAFELPRRSVRRVQIGPRGEVRES